MGESSPDSTPDWVDFRLGAKYRPPPSNIPLLRASLSAQSVVAPKECRWDQKLNLQGVDGLPDSLGNDVLSNCVPCATLRLMQLWTADGRTPTREQSEILFKAWGGSKLGTFTDTAFDRWCRLGFLWSGQRLIVPRWTVIENDGISPNIQSIKHAIYALGGALVVFKMPQSAMQTTYWGQPIANTPQAKIVGHHMVLLAGYDSSSFYTVSWGVTIPTSYDFLTSNIIHASAFASSAWVQPSGKTPSGLSFDQIKDIGIQIEGK